MPVGGARPGAGRKKGSLGAKTREIAAAVAESGITPLEVMIEAMMAARGEGKMDDAARYAKDAAPYIHPRLNSIDAKLSGSVGIQVIMGEQDADL